MKNCIICEAEIMPAAKTNPPIQYCALCAHHIMLEMKAMSPLVYKKAAKYIEDTFRTFFKTRYA